MPLRFNGSGNRSRMSVPDFIRKVQKNSDWSDSLQNNMSKMKGSVVMKCEIENHH